MIRLSDRAAYHRAYRLEKLKDDPFRLRSVKYLAFIRGKPCLICGLSGSAHHLQYAQPRALQRKTGDQWTVPLCHAHHMQLHNDGINEKTWWAFRGIDPLTWARRTYDKWCREQEWNDGGR